VTPEFKYYPGQEAAIKGIVEAWESQYPLVLLDSPVGCHRIGQELLMYDGSIKKVEDVVVGDRLMGPDSRPRRVLTLIRGRGKMVRILPIKGDSFVVNEDHLLSVVETGTLGNDLKKRLVRRGRKRSQGGGGYQFRCEECGDIFCARTARRHPRMLCVECRYVRTGRVVDVSVKEFLSWSRWRRGNHKLVRVPIQFKQVPTQRLPLEPYFLGVLLGDGSFSQGGVLVTSADAEIVKEIYRQAERFGVAIRVSNKINADGRPNAALDYHFTVTRRHGGRKQNPITVCLRRLRLMGGNAGTKFIPSAYQRASKTRRLQLLAGLIDTDGYRDGHAGYGIYSKSRQLARDIAFVVRSVGLAAYVDSRRIGCQTGAIGTYWQVRISGDCSIIPCRIERKIVKPRAAHSRQYGGKRPMKDVLRTGFRIQRLNTSEHFYGFALDGDGRYLLNDFTVTHNSGKSLMAALAGQQAYERWGWKGYLTTPYVPLVRQYANDPLLVGRVQTIMGRRNYSCHARNPNSPLFLSYAPNILDRIPPDPEASADEGYCAVGWPCKTCGGVGWYGGAACHECTKGFQGGGAKNCPVIGQCDYFVRKQAAQDGQLAVMTLSYLLAIAKGGSDEPESNALGEPRNYLFVDEAHDLDRAGLQEMAITLRPNEFGGEEWSGFWDAEVAPILALGNFDAVDVPGWLQKVTDQLALIYGILQQRWTESKTVSMKVYRMATHAKNLYLRAQRAATMPGIEWILDSTDTRAGLGIQAQPIDPKGFLQLRLWDLAKCKVLMSGTFGNVADYVSEIGLPNDYKLIPIPSHFPPANAPVLIEDVAAMSMAKEAYALPLIIARIARILDQEPERGIIHAPSYKLARAIEESLSPIHAARLVTHDSASRNAQFGDWLKDKRPNSVFIGVAMTSGIDLKEEAARFQIIVKAPFPSLGDRRVAARFKRADGPRWYRAQSQRDLLQALGRVVRSASDVGRTYVLDEHAGTLLRDSNAPAWAKARIAVGDSLVKASMPRPWMV
jgi:Helicase C-terminal domain/Hom_end-associated Hint/LAGLIDADG-like domain